MFSATKYQIEHMQGCSPCAGTFEKKKCTLAIRNISKVELVYPVGGSSTIVNGTNGPISFESLFGG